MSEAFVEAFAEGMRSAQRAFEAGDFESAFAGLSPDVEWRTGDWLLDAWVLNGRDAVIRFFRANRDVGHWAVEAQEFFDAGEGRVVVHQRGRWVGRTTRIEGNLDFFQLWEVRADGLVSRVREYESREDARSPTRGLG